MDIITQNINKSFESKNLESLILNIKSNLYLVFKINKRIIELLSEEEANINSESLSQMVDTRNSLIEKSVILINDSENKNFNQIEDKNVIEDILNNINEQEHLIQNLFEKQLNILRSDIVKLTNTKNVNLYKKSN